MGRAPDLGDGYAYSKAGLITDDLVALATSQRALPGIAQFDRVSSTRLMNALDSLSLAPRIVKAIFQIIYALKASVVSILLVEQNARAALKVAD